MITLNKNKLNINKLVLSAVFTSIVIVIQLLATFTAFFGPFSTAMALIPIVLGAAMCGVATGAWLGFVFAMVVLLSGGANLFLAFSIPGTIITVIAKGTACGLFAGLAYKALERFNKYVAVFASAILCPIVNTGIFLLGSAIFFLKDAPAIAADVGSADNGMALFIAFAAANFLFELGANIVLSPVILRLLNIKGR